MSYAIRSGTRLGVDPGAIASAEVLTPNSRGSLAGSLAFESRVETPLELAGLLVSAEEILYDSTDWWRWVVQQLVRHGVCCQYDTIYPVWRRDFLDGVNDRRWEYWDAFHRFLRSLGCSQAFAEELACAARPRRNQFMASVRAIPDMRYVVARLLTSNLRLFVMSCAPVPAEDVQQRLRNVGWTREFTHVTSAWQRGRAASDSQLYTELAEEWKLPPSQLAVVGRDPAEVAAAVYAGMRGISYAPAGSSWQHVRISHLRCLPDIVRAQEAHRMAG